MSALCKVGLHRWAKTGTTRWLQEPRDYENKLGLAIEYRECLRCGRLRDVTTWIDSADPDFGFPKKVGPLAGQRIIAVLNGPRRPLAADPLPVAGEETQQ